MSKDFLKGLEIGIKIGINAERTMNCIEEYEMLLHKEGYSESEIIDKVRVLTEMRNKDD